METIRKVRLSLAKGESQRSIAKKHRVSRKTAGKIASCEETEFKYTRKKEVQYLVLGSFIERLWENWNMTVKESCSLLFCSKFHTMFHTV